MGQHRLVAVGFDHQQCAGGGQVGAADLARQAHAVAVHELEHRGRHRLRHQARHCGGGAVHVGVQRAQRTAMRGHGREPERGLDDQRQRALRPDEDAREVVAAGALGGGRAEAHQLAGAGDGGERQHVVARGAVLHRARAAGVAGQVAADAAVARAGGVGRPEQAVRRQRGLQVAVEQPGLHHGDAVARPDGQHAVHALERHHQRVLARHAGTGGVGAAPARDDRQLRGPAQLDDGLHLRRHGRQRHRQRQALAPRVVVAIGQPLGRVGQQAAGAQQRGQLPMQSRCQARWHRWIVVLPKADLPQARWKAAGPPGLAGWAGTIAPFPSRPEAQA